MLARTSRFAFLKNGSRLLALLSLGAARSAFAQPIVAEPNGVMVPQPPSPAEVSCCVTGRGYPASAASLSGLFAYRNDPNLDQYKDAKTGPGVFSPLCGFEGTLVLRGGNCRLDFGWYNVTAGGAAPADNEIYTLIPKDDVDVYGNGSVDFCPLAGVPDANHQGEANKCKVKSFSAAAIRMDPHYKGGLIGFALRGDKNSRCSETHYSQNELHKSCTGATCPNGGHWIMSLQYESKAFPDSYYLAFEDKPVTTFGPNDEQNDGDFNDFVFFVTGVTCAGGGQPCDASVGHPERKGVCAVGRTGCAAEGQMAACNPIAEASPEKCNNLDDDCDGAVDNGQGLCEPGEVCDRGACVNACGSGEFRCPSDLVCSVTGYCVDASCKDVVCQDGQVCRGGTCTGGCNGAVCPIGQECQLGRCIDPCDSIKCEDNQICEKGVCISSCTCRPCAQGKACRADGRCVDAGCESMTCDAASLCVAGQCKNACEGVVCPGGAACSNGKCGEPLTNYEPPTNTGGSGGGVIPTNGGSPFVTGGMNSGNASNGTGANSSGTRRGSAETGGCNCHVASNRGTSAGALAGLLAFASVLARRRRRTAA
ncbi:MAG TPA: MYXO-CTERM sorting domain-containing protein [Polyangiaceae bacterium]|nr:MYXO-CTERM sorting domain-containing protein [Polyangiaceae bacterium]